MNHREYLLEQARLINDTAYEIYGASYGGIQQNFFAINVEYENGRTGWIKENISFEAALSVYELYTANESHDVLLEIRECFPEIDTISIEEFKKLTDK